MIRSAVGKVVWVGRATVFLVGLAVILALVLGLASTALAANGKPFLLGRLSNAATAVTKLTANIAGPALNVSNASTAPSARALHLNVAAGKPPLTVNPAAGTATGLSADEIDGKDSSAFMVTGDGKQGNFVNIDSCGSGPVLSYPLTLTRSARILATASSVYGRSSPGPERPSIQIQLLDGSNTVVAQSGRVATSESGNPTLSISEVLLNMAGDAAYDAPAGNYTLRIFGDNFGTCAGFGQYQSPRLTHVVLAEGQ